MLIAIHATPTVSIMYKARRKEKRNVCADTHTHAHPDVTVTAEFNDYSPK